LPLICVALLFFSLTFNGIVHVGGVGSAGVDAAKQRVLGSRDPLKARAEGRVSRWFRLMDWWSEE
jgi:hypothetical protein